MADMVPMIVTVEQSKQHAIAEIMVQMRQSGAVVKGDPTIFGTINVDAPFDRIDSLRGIAGVEALEADRSAHTADDGSVTQFSTRD